MTFDQEGQNIYCASPSGLRRWTWDNNTATAKLKTMGDMGWGKVGVGALHYNADGRQVKHELLMIGRERGDVTIQSPGLGGGGWDLARIHPLPGVEL